MEKKILGSNEFTVKFCQNFKKELIPTLLKLFNEMEREGTPANSFCEAHATLIPKLDKTQQQQKKENYRPISLMNTDSKILGNILVN
jgi:hypothetical protein